MLMTKCEFDRRYQAGTLRLAFIGASNAGKTFRAKQLASSKGFAVRSIDDEIGALLGRTAGTDLAQWLGQPHEQRFPTHQARYLELEEGLTRAAKPPKAANFILDTTGSVIHLSDDLQVWLKKTFLVVYARLDQCRQSEWLRTFVSDPKPLIWGALYRPNEGETRSQTLHRCAAQLLAWRHAKYRDLADIDLWVFGEHGLSTEAFWAALRDALS